MSAFSQETVIQNTPLPVDTSGQTINVGNFPAVQPVSATNLDIRDLAFATDKVDVSGSSVTTTPVVSSSSTVTQITSNSSNQTLLAANASRKKAILHFLNGTWDVKFGATASPTSRTLRVSTAGFILEVDTWTGIIDAICTTNGKLVDITELV